MDNDTLSCSAAAVVVERVGRRRLFLVSNAGMALMFAGWTIFTALYMEMSLAWAGNGEHLALYDRRLL